MMPKAGVPFLVRVVPKAGITVGSQRGPAVVGIGVGAAAGDWMLLVAAAWLLRRRRCAARPAAQTAPGPTIGKEFDEVKAPIRVPPAEAPA